MYAYTPCPLDKALNAKEDNHKKIYTLDSTLINICIKQIEKHVSNYPPSFKDPEEKNLVIKDLVTLTNILRDILENGTNNTELSLVYAWCLAMSHNVDIPNSDLEANKQFQDILTQDPDNARANFLYGIFLVNTPSINKSIPFLKKAEEKGQKQANLTLAVAYLAQNNVTLATKYLETYLKYFPNDLKNQELLKALKSDNFKITRINE
jgi:Tfp pilus assembly protein PilF